MNIETGSGMRCAGSRLATMKLLGLMSLVVVIGWTAGARAGDLDGDLLVVQQGWAQAYYRTPEPQKDDGFKALERQAEALVTQYPARPEPLVWEAIVLSSHARFEGGLGALRKIKQARELLLAAEKIDPTTLEGSIYTSLGSLYAKSPGWPIAFGDKKKAKVYLERALAINPQGIDPNFFYGELLADLGDKAGARQHLQAALDAPPRAGREAADDGRRAEAQAALSALN